MNNYPPNQYPPNQSPQNPSPPPEQAQSNQYPPNQYPNAPYPPNQYQSNPYQQNPYYQQPPYQMNQAGASPYVPCPRCNMHSPQPVKFTWWGGVVGPKMLSHVKCVQCGLAYNGKSGKSNTTGIMIYSIVAFVIFFILGITVILMMNK